MPAPEPPPTYLYKILPSAPPSPLPSRLPLSDLDRNDGYIHLSTSEQVPGTADKFFSDANELWLLRLDYATVAKGVSNEGDIPGVEGKAAGTMDHERAEIKWEEVGRGCFAHLYGGDLGVGNVESVIRVERKGSWGESLTLVW